MRREPWQRPSWEGRGAAATATVTDAKLVFTRADGIAIRFAGSPHFVWDSPRGASVFVAAHGNETSSGEEESSGSIRFSRVSCRLGGVVAFTIDATLDSEIGKPPITVVGRFRGHVSRRP